MPLLVCCVVYQVFVREANLRIPYVEQQIKNLTDDDKEKGWEESFINEWLTLKNQLIMVRRALASASAGSRPRVPSAHTHTAPLPTPSTALVSVYLCSLPAPPPLCY